MIKAFDVAQQLPPRRSALPSDSKNVVYEAGVAKGVVAARTAQESIVRLGDDLSKPNKKLQFIIDKHAPAGSQVQTISLVPLTVAPETVNAFADLTSLFTTDVSAFGIA